MEENSENQKKFDLALELISKDFPIEDFSTIFEDQDEEVSRSEIKELLGEICSSVSREVDDVFKKPYSPSPNKKDDKNDGVPKNGPEELYDDVVFFGCLNQNWPSVTKAPKCCFAVKCGYDSDEELMLNRKLHECPHCGLRFILSIRLKNHIRTFHGPEYFYSCSRCRFTSHILSQVRRHVREAHTAEKRHQCPYCKYRAKRSTHLRRHIEARHDASKPPRRNYTIKSEDEEDCTKEYAVVIAGEIPDSPPDLESQESQSEIKRKIKKEFSDISDEKPFTCDKCPFISPSIRSLRRHIQLRHSAEGEVAHKCAQCDVSLPTLRELRYHIKADHENAKVFECPFCAYKTVHLGSLKNHVSARHTEERAHKCPHCRYSAVQAGNLARHVRAKHPNGKKRAGRKPNCLETPTLQNYEIK